jgi:methionyl aminopeptidase
MKSEIKPGVTSFYLEKRLRDLIEEGGDKPAFLNYKPRGARRPYPAALCLSVNDAIVHGIPNEKEIVLNDGDIVSIDFGLVHKGMITDMAYTMPVGNITKEAKELLAATEEAMYAGIKAAKGGKKTGDIGSAIEKIGIIHNFGIVEELSGHGVGSKVHEDPFVPNYGDPGMGVALKPGMTIAIEPMFNLGSRDIYLDGDGYTYRTSDGSLSAHFEHTILITKGDAEILTKI